MAGVMNAVSRQEIENLPSVGTVQRRTRAAVVGHIHPEDVEQPHPLGIDVIEVSIQAGWGEYGFAHRRCRIVLWDVYRDGPRCETSFRLFGCNPPGGYFVVV